jgi:hypothetical protein
MTDPQMIRLRDTRSLPFFWISRTLLKTYGLSWRGILAYTALAYFVRADSSKCENVGIKIMAETVGVSEDTMKRGLAELAKKKVIAIKARVSKRKNGKPIKLPNEYTLLDLKDEIEIPL